MRGLTNEERAALLGESFDDPDLLARLYSRGLATENSRYLDATGTTQITGSVTAWGGLALRCDAAVRAAVGVA